MLFLWVMIIIAIIIGGMAYIMSNTGTPSNKEMDLVDLRIQKYKNQIETMLKKNTQEIDKLDDTASMEAELAAMVNLSLTPSSVPPVPPVPSIELTIEELPLNAIDL